MKKLSIILIIFSLSVLLGGCGQKLAEKAIESSTGVEIDNDGQKVTYTSEDGDATTTISGQGQLPDDYPKEVKYYDGELNGAASVDTAMGKTFVLTIKTSDSVDQIVDFYKKYFNDTGWEITSELNLGGMNLVNAEKDNFTLGVSVSEEEREASGELIFTHNLLMQNKQ